MDDINIFSLLQKFSGDVVAGAGVACVCAFLVKKFFHSATKALMGVAFVCAFALTFFIDYFTYDYILTEALSGGITAGALAITLTAFIKHLAFSDKKSLKDDIEKLLSSIIISDNLDSVVDDILTRIKENDAVTKTQIRTVLKECLDKEADEATLNALTDLVCDALGLYEKEEKKKE